MSTQVASRDVFCPRRWGLPERAIPRLGERLREFWSRFGEQFKTKTRDPSEQAWVYLRGLLTMEGKRNFRNIARRVNGLSDDGQNVQYFMSESPWSARAVMDQVQEEIAATPGLRRGGVVILDESAVEKAGGKSVGAARQHNGRLGKIEMSQVGTFLGWTNGFLWTWVDGELFIPERWFSSEMAEERKRVGLPEERRFETKIELGWRMTQRAQANGLPFEAAVCDEFYGRSGWLRRQWHEAGILYMADVPGDTFVYLSRPEGPRKAPKPCEVREVARRADTHFQRVPVRPTERGYLEEPFALRRVWTIRDGTVAEEWLVIRREGKNRYSYGLSNASADTPRTELAWLKCVRYFIERAHEDAKSEMGWDELQAQKYRAWEHHLALTVLASWFVAGVKREWAEAYPRDPKLARQLGLDVLPLLSVANVRELLRAALPLDRLTPQQATRLVVKHLVNRSHSTRSRLKAQHRKRGP